MGGGRGYYRSLPCPSFSIVGLHSVTAKVASLFFTVRWSLDPGASSWFLVIAETMNIGPSDNRTTDVYIASDCNIDRPWTFKRTPWLTQATSIQTLAAV